MAKIVVVNDIQENAEMAAAPLKAAGHKVLTELVPIDWERVMDFGPKVIVLPLYRHKEARNRPIQDPRRDILGYEALIETEQYPAAAQNIPIVLLGYVVAEQDIDTSINYDLFLNLPDDVKLYEPKVRDLATKVKTRRKISGYICPKPGCGSRLLFINRDTDLFCPKCGSAVAIIDHEHCTWLCPEGKSHPCKVRELKAVPK